MFANWSSVKVGIVIGASHVHVDVFIVQELQDIFPELVDQNADKNLHVSYEKLTPILVKTLQSQINAIKSIKKRIEKLEK